MKQPHLRFIHLIALALLLLGFYLPLEAKHYIYKQISLEAGLPTTLSFITSDSRGFIWTGTQSGLGRFDGHEQRRYIHQPGNPNSLPGNKIFWMVEDSHQNLLILTDGGIARYNYHSNDFTTLVDTNGKRCLAYCACPWEGTLLFGGDNRIYEYDAENNRVKEKFSLGSAKDFMISRLAIVEGNTLLCGSRWDGIQAIDLNNGKAYPAPFDCGEEITDLFVDSKQRIWIAPYNQGVRCYTMDGRFTQSYTTQNSQLSSDIVICLKERKGKIWIGTDGGGINILDPELGQFSILQHIPGEKRYSLPTNSINCLYNDPYGNMWMGGVYNGLINIREASMKTHMEALTDKYDGYNHSIVISLHQENKERIWIGTDGGGLISFNPKTEQFKSYPTTLHDKVTSICKFQNGKLLISLFAEGLFVFDTQTGQKTPFMVIDENTTKNISKHGYSVYLYRNTPNSILILSDHVYLNNLATGQFSIAKEEQPNLINWGTLQSIGDDGQNSYLFDIKRIYALNHSTNTLSVLLTMDGNSSFNSVAFDPKGFFWIGTNQGLHQYILETQRMTTIRTNLFNDVSVVVSNPGKEVWIGAENKLFAYLPKEDKFSIFGESDGAIPNEFIPRAQLVVDQQNIYMGGVKGLLHISDEWKKEPKNIPELHLSDIVLNGEPLKWKANESHELLRVPWKSNIAIKIMAKEEDIFRKKLYRFRIVGLDDSYSESYNPELVIRTPPQGSYQIMVSCTARDGSWIADQQILMLEVLPPWYQTWWFITLCIALATGIFVETFRRTLKNKDQKLKWAMKEHEQQVYEEKVRFLINISQELRTPLTLIYAPLMRILKSLTPDALHYQPLRTIHRQTKRMESLLNMVLDVRKMEEGAGKLHISPQPFNEWIKNVSNDFITEDGEDQIQINYQLDRQIGHVSFDKEKCEIVLSNILVNAIKNNPPSATITISSEILPGGQLVRVAITDQGQPHQDMGEEKNTNHLQKNHIENNGTGIGLAYAKILIEQHGGAIGVKKNHGSGTTHYFDLPLKKQEEDIVTSPKAYLNELISEQTSEIAFEEDKFDTSAFSVLIADSSPDMIEFLQKNLSYRYKRLLVANNGEEAMQIIKSHTPDIVISEAMMPRMNGYQLCMHIKEEIEISHIPVILLIDHDDEQSKKDGYKTGADAILAKPFEVETLIELIGNRLKTREKIRRRYMNTGPIPVPQDTTYSQADEKFLFKLNSVIQENIDNSNLSIPLICKAIGMSRASLYNKLKALTNMSANEYINKFRMERAIHLIHTTELGFNDIAEKVGFSTSSYFSTAFKQYTGETPSQYKKKLKKDGVTEEMA